MGTEPYIVGGHTASGYWVDTNRETTIHGLFAGGDVAGGCPQKYVTGALVEGEICAKSSLKYIQGVDNVEISEDEVQSKLAEYTHYLENNDAQFTTEQLEEAMQKVMDNYAGGISTHYQFNEKQLNLATEKIKQIIRLSDNLHADDLQELMYVYELKERLTVCLVLIEHLKARKETRWHSFAENLDYPNKSENWLKYVNSKLVNGKIEIIFRDLVKVGETYEHSNK